MENSIVDFSWTITFQILNTVLFLGIVYLIYSLLVKVPKRIKANEEKIVRIERMLEEINKKLD